MDLFSELEGCISESAQQTIVELTHIIIERHTQRGLSECAWSLAELSVDDEDHEFVCHTLGHLPKTVLRDYLKRDGLAAMETPLRFACDPVTMRGALGLLILLACAESARRLATNGEIWPAAAAAFAGPFPSANALHAHLFMNGQPTVTLKQAIRDAVTQFRLRNALPALDAEENSDREDGDEDSFLAAADQKKRQWWFQTLKLQYGITTKGVTGGTLTDLIAFGGGSDAARWLLYGRIDSDETTLQWGRSETFRRFVSDLQQFRREAISGTELRSRLGRSPWLPPATDFKDIEKAARHRPRQGNGSEIGMEPNRLVSDLRLLWNANTFSDPVLQFCLEPEALNGVLEECVTIKANKNAIADAVRQDDGQMLPIPRGNYGADVAGSPFLFRIPFRGAPELTVSLSTTRAESEDIHCQEFTPLYQPTDEVSAFHLDGRSAGAGVNHTLTVGRPYLLLLGEGLQLGVLSGNQQTESAAPILSVDAAVAVSHPLGVHGTLYAVAPGWSKTLCAFFPDMPEEEPLWVSRDAKSGSDLPSDFSPEWVATCQYQMECHPGESPLMGLRITLPENVTVKRVRYGGQSALAPDANGLWGTIPCATAPRILEAVIWLAHDGDKPIQVRTFVLSPQEGRAFYWWREWKACPAAKTIPTRSLGGGNTLRVFPPKDWNCDRDVANESRLGFLFEGTRLLGPVALGLSRQQSARFSPPSGWGGALTVRCRRFNDSDEPIAIAKAAADFGVLSPVEPTDCDETGIRLRFMQAFTRADEVRVHLWDVEGDMTTYPASAIQVVSSLEWRIPPCRSRRSACIVALSFQGVRIGAREIGLARALPHFGLRPERYETESLEGKEPSTPSDSMAESIAGPMATAAWLRWLHLPLLRGTLFPALKSWLRDRGGAEAVVAWVRGVGLPAGYALDTAGEAGWSSALRQFVEDWTPTSAQAKELLTLLYPPPTLPSGERRIVDRRDEVRRVGHALAELVDVSPDLACKTLAAYWDGLPARQREPRRASRIKESVQADWHDRFLALIQSENEKRKPENKQENLTVNDDAVLNGLASALQLSDTFLKPLLWDCPPSHRSEKEQGRWRDNRTGVMETSGELRALSFLTCFDRLTMPIA